MTTLQQNQPPLFVYAIHEYEEQIYGTLIDWKPWFQAIRDYEINYDFRGKEAHYILLSDDRSITRAQALGFATAVHTKKRRIISIELGALT